MKKAGKLKQQGKKYEVSSLVVGKKVDKANGNRRSKTAISVFSNSTTKELQLHGNNTILCLCVDLVSDSLSFYVRVVNNARRRYQLPTFRMCF